MEFDHRPRDGGGTEGLRPDRVTFLLGMGLVLLLFTLFIIYLAAMFRSDPDLTGARSALAAWTNGGAVMAVAGRLTARLVR